MVGIDSEAGPTEIAILADDTADAAYVAADLISQAEHDPLAASVLVTDSQRLADDVEAELDKQVSATRHTERIRTALTGHQSGIVLVDDLDQGLDVVNAYAAEHLEIHTADASAVRRPGAQRRRDLRRAVRPGLASATTAPAPTTCCPPPAAPATPRALGARVHQVGARHRLLPRGARRGRRPRRDAGRGRGPARPRRRGARSGWTEPMSWPPLREELRGIEPYGAPQLDVPVQLNVNENPYGPSLGLRRRHRDRGRPARRPRSTATPTGSSPSCAAALAAYLSRDTPHGVTAEQVWAANGSNEVMLQLLQAFGGPGPVGAELRADVLDVSRVRPRHDDRVGRRAPRRATSPSTSTTPATWSRSGSPSVVLLPSPEQPDRHRAAARGGRRCSARRQADGIVVVDEAYGEFRRAGTPSALELLPEHRNLVVTRTMSKAFALAGRGSATSPPTRRSATRIRVVRLPYHLSAVTQATALAALRHAPELLGKVDELRAERDAHGRLAARAGAPGRRLRRQLRVVRDLRGPPRCLAGAARPRRADPGDRARRVAAGLDRHRGRDGGVQGRTDRR